MNRASTTLDEIFIKDYLQTLFFEVDQGNS
jgi:hypothetical protein